MIRRGQQLLSRARTWYSGRPAWAKVLLILLLIGLLPWLLIVAGLTITGIGMVGLRRGSLPAFRLSSRAAATGAVLVGLATLAAGSGLAASVISSDSPPARTDPPIAAPPTSSATPTTPTRSRPATTAKPSAPRPSATVTTPRQPTRPPPPAPAPSRQTPRPAPALTVTIVSLPPTGQGNVATATAQTMPSANCSIVVEYKSGPSTARGLDPKTAASTGAVAWSWIVGSRTTPGSWPVTVTCSRNGQTDTAQRDLTVFDTGNPG
jgi:hypothetical protein